MKHIYSYSFPIGILQIEEEENTVTAISLTQDSSENTDETSLLKETKNQLDEYFNGKRQKFNLPLNIQGTDFQKAVYKGLLDIPYGKTQTYQGLAEAIGAPKAARAVGNANNKNRLLIVVPCHRVVPKNGSVGGFALGQDVKKFLLELEKRHS